MEDEEEDYSEDEDYDEPEEKNIRNVFGGILIFSFLITLTIFIASLIIVATNDYIIFKLYGLTSDFVTANLIPPSYLAIAESMANNYPKIIDYLDMMFLSAFVSMVVSSIAYSYYAKRENYFGILSYAVFGILILSFVGGVFIQISTWFKTNFMALFPSILPKLPMFNFYLNNAGLINLVLLIICLLINFLDLDFSKFNNRKDKDLGEEI